MTQKDFNKLFDHTLLKAFATWEDLKKICDEAKEYGFASVAVNSGVVKQCADYLKGSDVAVLATVGFPLGITTVTSKCFEAEEAIRNGATEIDYVVHVGKAREGDVAYLRHEMEEIVAVCRKGGAVCKVIFENCYLTDDEKIMLCKIASEVKPDFVKTSTGFGTGAATVEDVRLMREHTSPDVKVKAAGGVRDLASCMEMLKAGAERVGCSASVAVAREFAEQAK